MVRRYWVETLGCPKNEVDSAKLVGTLVADGYQEATSPERADLVVVNTCAFVEAARQESIETVLALADARMEGARLVVTGCMAERYGAELAAALPEVDQVAGFGVPVTLGTRPSSVPVPSFDLLNLPRPRSGAPWAYVKVAEGCDRACGFCAIPSFRGKQRSRTQASILAEVEALEVQEVVLVAQDLASYGRDIGRPRDLIPLVRTVSRMVPRTRLLYLYPSELSDGLIEVMGETACPYFDLSLQHASRPHLRRMRRWGDGARSKSASPPSGAATPTPRSVPPSLSATRARRRTTTTSCWRSSRRRNSIGPASSRSRQRWAPTPPISPTPWRRA